MLKPATAGLTALGMAVAPAATAAAPMPGPSQGIPKIQMAAPPAAAAAKGAAPNITINITGAPGQNEEEIARRVMAELDRKLAQQRRGALHD